MIARVLMVSLLMTVATVLAPAAAWSSHELFAVYEDWSAPTIRPDRWSGITDSAQEVERQIHRDHLVMRLRKAGFTFSDAGVINAFHRLTAANGVAIDQLQADVRVRSIEVSGCADNPGTAVVPVALTLTKFNDGTGGGAGNGTGDHLARIRVRREATSTEPAGALAVEGFLFRCGDPACVGGTFVFLERVGTVTVGKHFSLRLVWDAPNSRFIYGVGNVDTPIPYAPALNTRPAFAPLADLRMQSSVANCTAGSTQTDAKISVREIRTNASAVIP